MTPLPAAADHLRRAIELDFASMCTQLTEARQRQRQKDSTGNRASVAECRARIDAILDLHLETEGRRGADVPAARPDCAFAAAGPSAPDA